MYIQRLFYDTVVVEPITEQQLSVLTDRDSSASKRNQQQADEQELQQFLEYIQNVVLG